MVEFTVQHGDVMEVQSDLLLLKHAMNFFGADLKVASRLTRAGLCTLEEIQPEPGEAVFVEAAGRIAPAAVMFLGTVNLGRFKYEQMEQFAARAVELLAERHHPVATLTTTVHGVGYGLDAGESLQSLVRGFRAGLARRPLPALRRVTFVERHERTARILAAALAEVARGSGADLAPATAPRGPGAAPARSGNGRAAKPDESPVASAPVPAAAAAAAAAPAVAKEHVFVAMPFSEEFEDVYEYGIYRVVRELGYVCEKVDAVSFTGDILKRIKQRIRTARFVIADLSDARPNVSLEVGYAWGRKRPVILLARDEKDLHFDVKLHRCLFYRSIRQLSKDLEKLILELYGPAGGEPRA